MHTIAQVALYLHILASNLTTNADFCYRHSRYSNLQRDLRSDLARLRNIKAAVRFEWILSGLQS